LGPEFGWNFKTLMNSVAIPLCGLSATVLSLTEIVHRRQALTHSPILCLNHSDAGERCVSMTVRLAVLILITLFSGWLPRFDLPAQTAESTASPPPAAAAPPDATYVSVRKLLQQGKYDEAIAALTALQSQTPRPKGLDHELGVAYYKKGDYPSAVRSLQGAQKEEPNDGEVIQITGLSLYLAGKPAEAIPYLEKVQTWYPRANVDASYILGVAYMQTKKYDEGRAAFAKMFGVPPDSAAAYLFAARMLLRLDFGPIAEEYGQKAVTLDAKLPLAHQLLGELYLYQSKIPEAIAQLEQELAVNPANPVALYKLADAYTRIQKFDEAEKFLQRSIWLDATSTGPYILMGKVLEKKGEALLAVRALQRAINMDPNNSISHHLLGQAYRDLGRSEDAERELKLAEQLQARDASKQQ
jgi:tetratricopeptide (TPR) repeat protein